MNYLKRKYRENPVPWKCVLVLILACFCLASRKVVFCVFGVEDDVTRKAYYIAAILMGWAGVNLYLSYPALSKVRFNFASLKKSLDSILILVISLWLIFLALKIIFSLHALEK